MSQSSRTGHPDQLAGVGTSGREKSPPDVSVGDDDRRKRAAIAAQACETCRTRKSKCDEKRPKCGLCDRLGVNCSYREPQPTKKDRTLVEMMTVLNRIDAKVTMIGNNLTSTANVKHSPAQPLSPSSTSQTSGLAITSPHSTQTLPPYHSTANSARGEGDFQSEHISEKHIKKQKNVYQHLTPPHRLLMWPEVHNFLRLYDKDIEADLQHIKTHGTAYFLKKELQKHPRMLSADTDLMSRPIRTLDTANQQEARMEFPALTYERLTSLAEAFFVTFYCTHPAVDPAEFNQEILASVLRRGFGFACEDSVIVLMVCALGEMAIEGTTGASWNGLSNSGIRGGSLDKPPGLIYFNEVRKRLGFISTANTVKSIQALILVAVYYEACSRHMDHYRTVMDACLAIQVVIKTEQPIDWRSPRGNRIKVLYHVCNALENWFHFDLDMPGTNINELVDIIPLPGGDTESYANEGEEKVALHFLATSSLARVITRVQQGVYHETFTSELGLPYTGPPYQLLIELRRQLENWRNLLPSSLQWYDEDRLNFPLSDQRSSVRGVRMFSPLVDHVDNLITAPSLDIMQAEMRARYYYVVMLINRPHLFKMIHHPETVEPHDHEPIVQCVKACLLWPIAFYPVRDKKRLVTYLYAWTTNFMGVLMILRLVLQPGPLRQLIEPHIANNDMRITVVALLAWIKDMSQADGTAAWAWNILRRLYSDVDMALDSGVLD